MADTAVLRVDVASADFDKFKATFDAYAKTLEQTLVSWSKITDQVKAASSAMSNMAAPVAKTTASLQKFTFQWAETAKHARSTHASVESISKGLMGWKTALTGTLALLGIGGGLYGISALIQGSVADRNRALGLGLGYGAVRGLAAGGMSDIAPGWSTARYDATSAAYRGAAQIGVTGKLGSNNPLEIYDALDKAATYLKTFDENIRGTIAATSGLNDLFSPERLRTQMSLSQDEIETRRRAIKAAGDAATQAEEGVKKWTTFQITMESTRSVIQDVLVDKLSPLAKPLGELGEAIGKAFTAFMNTDEVTTAIKTFGETIQQWATWLQTKEGQKEFDDFIKQVGSMASALGTASKAILDIGGALIGAKIGGMFGPIGAVAGAATGAVVGEVVREQGVQPDYLKDSGAPFPLITDWLNKHVWDTSPGKIATKGAKPQQELMAAPGMEAGRQAGGQYQEWFKGWFTAEQQSTKEAARAAAQRDDTTQRMMGNLDDWFQRAGEREDKLNSTLDDFQQWLTKQTAGDGGGGGVTGGPGGPGGASESLRRRGTMGGGVGGGGVGAEQGETGTIGNYGASKLTGDAQRDAILKTIRTRESSGNYGAHAKGSSASGAYQFTDSTWRSMTKKFGIGNQYASAADAPAAVQDQVASAYVGDILKQAHGDVSKVPLAWYTGNIEGKISASALAANKGLTPGQYQAGWMKQYNKIGGGAELASTSPTANSTSEIRGPGGGNAGDANALLAEVKKTHPHLSNEQCVTLVKEFCGMGGTVRDWRRGQSAMSGDLKIGTPIATFMSRSGQQSDLYDAGQGVGAPGRGTTHAALFAGYTYDAQGNRTGMKIVNQWAGSGGARISTIPMGGFGEKGAENYFTIQSRAQQAAARQNQPGALDNDNWQMKPLPTINVHNKSGSEVHIAASTVMASA